MGGIPTATTQNAATIVPVGAASTGLITIKSADMDIQVPITTGAGKQETCDMPGCSCGRPASQKSALRTPHSALEATKELARPIPWPKLDLLEQQYEARLKADWQKLRDKVFSILSLKLPDPDVKSALRTPQSAIGEKAFAFDDNQRAAILKALKDHLGWYEPDADDSVIAWHYAQAYSMGLIQAAEMVGKERPLLDILKNNEIYTELITDGFRMVKDNATRAIRNDVIMEMEQGMVSGINPRNMAEILEAKFDDANSDWERLARTEMAGAAERAKLDEWEARKVDISNAVTVPVHPRCRCSTTIRDDGNGNLSAVFAPAPDACDWCLSLQEGDKTLAAYLSSVFVGKRTRDWYRAWRRMMF